MKFYLLPFWGFSLSFFTKTGKAISVLIILIAKIFFKFFTTNITISLQNCNKSYVYIKIQELFSNSI